MSEEILATHTLDNGLECTLRQGIDSTEILVNGILVESWWPPSSSLQEVDSHRWPPLQFAGRDGLKKWTIKIEAELARATKERAAWVKREEELANKLVIMNEILVSKMMAYKGVMVDGGHIRPLARDEECVHTLVIQLSTGDIWWMKSTPEIMACPEWSRLRRDLHCTMTGVCLSIPQDQKMLLLSDADACLSAL